MANERDTDDLDRNPLTDEEERGAGEDDFEDADEADEDAEDEELTDEVGSEGGSPGERRR